MSTVPQKSRRIPCRYRNMYPTATRDSCAWKYGISGTTSSGNEEDIGFSTNNAAEGNFLDTATSMFRPGAIVPLKAGGVPIKTASGISPSYSSIPAHTTVLSYPLTAFFSCNTLCARETTGSTIASTTSLPPRSLNRSAVIGGTGGKGSRTFRDGQSDSTGHAGCQSLLPRHR